MKNLNSYTVNENEKIIDALKIFNKLKGFSRLSLFVKNKKNQIIGSLTDGDVRRAIEKNHSIDLAIGEVCNKNFNYLNYDNNYVDLKKFKQKKIYIIPVLDENKKLIDIIDLEKTKSILPLDCFIMAGGRGKRLSPLTDTVPKPMLKLGSKPIIEHNIDNLISHGIRNIFISVNYLSEQIKDYFGDGSEKGINIEYIEESKPLGTIGALSNFSKASSENIIIINADLFTNINIESMYKSMIQQKADMVIASIDYKVDIPYAVFETHKLNIKMFKEKPSYMYPSNAGIYIFKRTFLSLIPEDFFYDITDLLTELIKLKKTIIHYPIKGYWVDIGTPNDFTRANQFVKYF